MNKASTLTFLFFLNIFIALAATPVITNVAIPNVPMKVGDVVTTTITVNNDGGTTFTFVSGTLAGYNLGSLSRTNSTTYTATFTITNGGTDYASGDDIPVANLVLSDGSTTNAPYAQNISQGGDPIDANRPAYTGTAPVAGARVNSAAVAYTLSENVSTGTITYTRTTGSTDNNSPHTYNLTAPDRIAGAHSFTITFSQALVNGTTYTVAFNGTDGAGNAATTVSNLGVVFDTTIPAITGVAPANNAFVNHTQVSYTLSEACQSGTITWTRTGGSTDGTIHNQSLTAPELTSGAHNNITLANPPTLVSGAAYKIDFNVTDLAGNNSNTVTRTNITFDNIPPSITGTLPAPNSFVKNTSVSYNLSEAVNSGTIVFTRTSGSSDGNSPHSYTLAGADRTVGAHTFTISFGQPLVSGAIYTVVFNATDASGNPTTVSNLNVTYDNTVPTITSTAPANNAFVNNTDVSYTLSENCSVGSGSGTITWTRTAGSPDGTHVQNLVAAELTSGAHNNITLSSPPTLVDGAVYSVAFAVTDPSGNNSAVTTRTNVTYDVSTPSITAVTATPNSGIRKVGQTVTVTLTAAGAETGLLAGSTLTVNGVNVAGSFTPAGGGNYTVTYTLVNGNADWAAGALPISIDIKDAAGNSTTANAFTDGNTLAGDSNIPAAPTGLDLDPAGDTGISSTDNITKTTTGLLITGSAENGSTVELFDGAVSKGTTASGGTFSFIISLVTEAVHPLTAKTTDAAGNTSSASATLNITIDTTPPSVPGTPDLTPGTDSGSSSTDNITNSVNPTFTGSAQNGSFVTINSSSAGDLITSAAVTGSAYSLSVGAIGEVLHAIRAYATDVAGNQSVNSAALNVTIDRTLPSVIGAQFFSSNDHDTGCGTGNDEVIHLTLSEPLQIADNTEPTLKFGASSIGFSVSVNNDFDNTCPGSGNGHDGASVYHSNYGGSPTIHLQSNGNNQWSSATKVSFTFSGTNIKDVAGNEMASFSNLSTTDIEAPTLASGLVFYPNGTGSENIKFQVSETLSLSNGAAVTGLTTTPVTTFTATYSTTNNVITMVAANGTWDDNILVNYSAGNISDGTNSMAAFSNKPIRLKSVHISSNNTNGYTQRAKPGDIVTLSFTSTATLSETPIVTIDGVGASVSGGPTYNATITTTTGNSTGVFSYLISVKTASDSTGVDATTDDSQMAFDKTVPAITPATIASNNPDPTLAKPGDVVTISFTVSEPLFSDPTVTIDGKTATINNTGAPNYTAAVTVNNTYNNGVLPFNLSVQDEVGNTASRTTTTNGSSVTFDKTLPFVSSINVDSGQPPLNGIGTSNGTSTTPLTYTVTFNEPVSGVNSGDFALSSLSFAGNGSYPDIIANITGVTGGPMVYTVTAAITSGTGTLRLNFVSDGSVKDNAGNVNTASFNTGQSYSIVFPEPSNNALTFTNSVVDVTSITVNWTNPALPLQSATHYLIVVKGPDIDDLAGSYPSVADGTYVNDDLDFTDGSGAVNVVATTTSYPFTTLLSGKTYDFKIIPYTLSPNNSNDNVNFLTTGNLTTQGMTPVTAFGSITIGSTAAPATISSLTTSFGAVNFSFKVKDDGLSPGADNAKLKFDQLVISAGPDNTVANWADVIAQAELKDITRNNTVTTTNIGLSSITFGSLDYGGHHEGTLDDNETKEYELRIRLKNPLSNTAPQTLDNKRFEFLVNASSFNILAGNSGIESTQTTNSDPSDVNTNNKVTVVATKLNFSTQPPATAYVLANLTQTPVVRAQDANGNTDLDYVTTVTVTNAGTLPMAGLNALPPNSLAASAGVVTFPANFQYLDDGNGTLTVSDATITNAVSSAVAVSFDNNNRINAGALAEPATILSLVNASPGVPVFDFAIVDDNGAGGDGSPTRISQIVLTQGGGNDVSNWTQAIAGARLSDGTNTLVGTVNSGNITFSGIVFTPGSLGYIADNTTKTYTLSIWLNATMGGSLATTIDNLNLVFQASEGNITLDPLSSDFSAGGTQSQNSGSTNIAVQVITTLLKFTTNPGSDLLVNKDISLQPPVPVVQAVDANNNRDLDYTSAITVTNAGSLGMSNTPANITNGIVTFANNFKYTSIGNGTLTVNAATLAANGFAPTNAVSSAVTVRVAKSSTITSGSGSEPSTLSSLVNTNPGVQVFDFKVTDDAGPENDGNMTILTQIVITQGASNNITNWTQALAGATLSDGPNTMTGVVGATTITFSSIPSVLGQVADNGNKTFKLSVWLKSALGGTLPTTIDGKQFEFEVLDTNVTTDVTGSSIINGESETSGSANVVTVVATQLDFTSGPTAISTYTDINSPYFVVQARDANANTDLNYTGSVSSITNSGGLNMVNVPTGNNFIAGVFDFAVQSPNFQFYEDSGVGTVTLTVSVGGSPTSAVSIPFQVSASEESFISLTTGSVQLFVPYKDFQDGSLNNSDITNSFQLAGFTLHDGDGTVNDVDGAQTVLSDLTVSITNFSHIRRIALYDGSNKIAGTEQAGAATVTWNGLSITAADDMTRDFTIRASFQNTVTDNDPIVITITSVATSGGSKFADPDGGGASTPSNSNKIDVDATQLVFTVQPNSYEGINEPVLEPQVKALDILNNLDLDHNFAPAIATPVAGMTNIPPQFINGVLDFPGFMYTSTGDGTITVSSTSVLGPTLNVTSNTVNVVHVTGTLASATGIEPGPTLKSGQVNRAIYGITFTSQDPIAGEPKLDQFTIDFGPSIPDITLALKNVRIYKSSDNVYVAGTEQNVTSQVTTTLSGHTLVVNFNSDPPVTTAGDTYYLVIDVVGTANPTIGSIQPQVIRTSYTGGTEGNIIVTEGSSFANEIGTAYTFEDISDPVIINRTPANGEKNHPINGDIIIEFNEHVTSRDRQITVTPVNPANGGPIVLFLDVLAPSDGTIFTFATSFPTGDTLKSDTKYYITIAKGDPSALTGFVDGFGNDHAGITSPNTWVFKTSDITPPQFNSLDVTNITLAGSTISVDMDEEGTVYYMVVDDGSPVPTNAEVFDPGTYSGSSVIATGSLQILERNILHAKGFSGTFSNNNDYTLYAIARDLAQPFNETPAVSSVDFTATNPAGSGVIVFGPASTDLCVGNFQPLVADISIIERSNNDFDNNNTSQDLNLVLPNGFEFDVTQTPTVLASGADFSGGGASASFVNKTILKLTMQNDGNSSYDRIDISNLYIKATGTVGVGGDITRLGGTALTGITDGTSFGDLNIDQLTPVAIFTDPDQNLFGSEDGNIPLSPDLPPGDDGTYAFSGERVSGNSFIVSPGVEFRDYTVNLNYTNEYGCSVQSTKVITIFDSQNAINGLQTLYCSDASTGTIGYGSKDNYTLEFLEIDTIALASGVPIPQSRYDSLLTSLTKDTTPSSSTEGSYFFDPTIFHTVFFDEFNIEKNNAGGQVCTITFFARYKSVFDDADQPEFSQPVKVYIPANPSFTVVGTLPGSNPRIYCEDTGVLNVSANPQPQVGISTGVYQLLTGTTNVNGLTDFSNGASSINTQSVYNDIGDGFALLRYVFTNTNSQCSNLYVDSLRVSPKPVADFNVSTAPCQDVSLVFQGSASIVTAPTTITQWDWDFDDADKATGPNPNDVTGGPEVADQAHIFIDPSTYQVSLQVQSEYGCFSDVKTTPVTVGGTPSVAFNFAGVSTDENLTFKSGSSVSSNDSFSALDWDFGDGSSIQTSTDNTEIITHQYASPGQYPVDLLVTSGIGCVNSLNHNVVVVNKEILTASNAYLEDFENNNGGWQALPAGASWAWGTPTTSVISNASSNGANVWTTNLSGSYEPNEKSYLYSSCFDMTSLSRPMISFNSFVQLDKSDGVVLQYSTDSLNIADPGKVWTALGSYQNGISSGFDWYNAQGLPSKPGNQPTGDYGWTESATTSWIEAKHALDAITVHRERVVFRMALGSVSPSPQNDGFAVDNVRIGNRTRTILLEQFTSTNGMTAAMNTLLKNENTFVNNFNQAGIGTQLVKLNYHVGFTGDDPFNKDNPSDPGSRALFYDVNTVPQARLDGRGDPAAPPERVFSSWGDIEYGLRTLQLAKATIVIDINTLTDGSIKDFSVDVTPNVPLPPTTVLQIAVVEAGIDKNVLSSDQQGMIKTGESSFSWVLKKLVPTAAGTLVGSTVPAGQLTTFGSYAWPSEVGLYTPANDLAIIAFLQDEETKEIYQAEIVSAVKDPDPTVITALDLPGLLHNVRVFPNPASKELTIQLPEPAHERIPIELYDNIGHLTVQDALGEGEETRLIDTSELSGGLYFLQLQGSDGTLIRKKILILHRNE